MSVRTPLLMLLAAAVALPAPATAQSRPKPTPPPGFAKALKKSQKQDRADQKAGLAKDLSAAKQKVKSGQPFFLQQWKGMRQAAREAARYEKGFNAAEARFNAAYDAFKANPTAQNRDQALDLGLQANARAKEFRAAAANAERAQGSFNRTREQRDAAVSQLVAARQAVKRGVPVAGRPSFDAVARLAPTAQPANYAVLQQGSLGSLMSSGSSRVRSSSNAADNGQLPPIPSTFGTPGSSTRSAVNSSRSESSRSTVYDLSFRQSDRSSRSSAEFTTFNRD
ncbi:hypothetical protein [Novosphingobium sp.]|uniref:hypothetical protein n=1 Tax=Novosphingobium sp. TaxID=1874826 RepID=UPI0026290350|nr:hypothetical protein [Novosphingobium sp.]